MTKKILFNGLLAFAAIGLFAHCSKTSNGQVSLTIKSFGSSRQLDDLGNRSLSERGAQTASRSFTPSSFKLPIMKIAVAKTDGSNEKNIYTCPKAAEADCLVDLANQAALDAISTAAQNAAVVADTYDRVSIYTCADGRGGDQTTTAKVTGTGTGPNGATWTTSATTVVDVTGASAAETVVGNWGCSTKNVIVKGGITVGSTPLTLTVVVDNYFGAYFNNLTSSGQGGCKNGTVVPTTNGLCVNYPALMAYVGTDTATTKRFSVAHDTSGTVASATKANALIIVAVNTSGTPLMAYGRQMFGATSEVASANTLSSSQMVPNWTAQYSGPNYITETDFTSFTAASNTSIAFQQGGSFDTYAAVFTAFNPAATHTGTVKSKDGVSSWNYLATALN